VYDPLILTFANRFMWRCPTGQILDLYRAHVTGRHLDVGPATGSLLRRCTFPVPNPEITLLDLNPNVLAVASAAISGYRPRTYQANLLEPLDLAPKSFDSIGMTHVLHCLPGGMAEKEAVLGRLRPLLRDGGTLFGTTVLGTSAPHTPWSRALMGFLNRKGVHDNLRDDLASLDAALGRTFNRYELRMRGTVAIFVGHA
jgi:ubiquinone/menaquinone biosynthesis C-methylase UbiE